MGHKMIIFDDPVQSMDDDHFKTFAESFIELIISKGFQILIFTHNYNFAELITNKFEKNKEYLHLCVKNSKRIGCRIDTGNRKVLDRLKIAVEYAEDENYDEAWTWIRLAQERFYKLILMIILGDNYKIKSYIKASSEEMWKSGVGDHIKKESPESAQKLGAMTTLMHAGPHDRQPNQYTDIINAVSEFKEILKVFKLENC
jgi:hypothetical protein